MASQKLLIFVASQKPRAVLQEMPSWKTFCKLQDALNHVPRLAVEWGGGGGGCLLVAPGPSARRLRAMEEAKLPQADIVWAIGTTWDVPLLLTVLNRDYSIPNYYN